MSSLPNGERAATVLSAAASLAASAILFRTIASDLVPGEVHGYFSSTLHSIFRYLSSQHTIIIEEFKGNQGHTVNELFEAAEVYLGTKTSPAVRKLRVGKDEEEKKLAVTIDGDEEIVDVFEDVKVTWRSISRQVESLGFGNMGGEGRTFWLEDSDETVWSEERSYELGFNKKHKDKVLNSYFPYILERAKAIKEENKVVKLHTVNTHHGCWRDAIILDHPMTFQTLAMDSELKTALLEDLDNFVKGKAFYKRMGKTWRRGYLLYGPSGTGKSSLIAAMANHLNYDIYDMDLTGVGSNDDLRLLLLAMPSKAILVIEDVDCVVNLQNQEDNEEDREDREEATTGEPYNPWDEDGWVTEDEIEPENQVTLSGFLNLINGLLSCCSEEQILVFTTNHREQLDPALLRPGCIDMEIHMSCCTISAFKQLAWNYLGLYDHPLFEQIERLMGEVKVTPAEVAGELMKSKDADVSLQGVIEFFHKKIEKNEAKTAKDNGSIKGLENI
ncbi:AAA-ATPase At3g50940-like [Vitis riparia]|uniref:AAA-ATPase At3g50940-like n=1 Tax=Vitis riparia TaxID=96939 RepID=UPI00155B256D|nr:AAA-ATPase At3g50940-like [Vitis riparia]